MSTTYFTKKRKRKRTHGFRKRQRTKQGREVLKKRREKKRWKITV